MFCGTKVKCCSLGLQGQKPKISKPKLCPCFQPSAKKLANLIFLWVANRNSVKVVKKRVKSKAKYYKMAPNFKTPYLGLGIAVLRTSKGYNHVLALAK